MSYSAQRFQESGTNTKPSRKRKTRREKVSSGEPIEVKEKSTLSNGGLSFQLFTIL